MVKLQKFAVAVMCVLLSAAMLCSCAGTQGGGTIGGDTEKATEEPTATEAPDVMVDVTLDAEYASAFTVSKAFSSDMVVQRGEYIRVWGWADESENGKKVSATFMGMFTEAIIENGEWVIQFKAKLDACADTGNTLRIYTDTQSEEFEDVLVGDVYFMVGQSNCAYDMSAYWSYKSSDDEGPSKSDIDESMPIRILYLSQNATTGLARGTEEVNKDLKTKKAWKIAKKGTISSFSALGYLFAYNYVNLTDGTVPIGVIEIDGNGRPLGSFVPNAVAEEYETDTWSDSLGYYQTYGVNAQWGRFMYNEYMAPLERMAIAGMLWYQGESDLAENTAVKYDKVFNALVEYMRGTHNLVNRDFPVYFIEFPPMYTQPSNFTGSTWAYMDIGKIRAIMGTLTTMGNEIYQIQSGDLWYDREFWNNLHPNCKYAQALRAAKIAAANNGEGNITLDNASGPIVESVEMSKDKKTITITYKNVGDGLTTSDGGTAVKGFYPATGEYSFGSGKNLTAEITSKNTVVLKSTTELEGFVYHAITTESFGNEITLCNSAGIPAGAYWYYQE